MKKIIFFAAIVSFLLLAFIISCTSTPSTQSPVTKETIKAIKEPFSEMALTEKNMDLGIVEMKALERYREKRLKAFCKCEKAIKKEWRNFLTSREEALGELCPAGVCPYSELLLGKEEIAAYKGEKNMSGTFPGIEQYLKEVGEKYAKFEKTKNAFYQEYKKADANALKAMRQQIEKVDQSEKNKKM
jgi:hypothetical protein